MLGYRAYALDARVVTELKARGIETIVIIEHRQSGGVYKYEIPFATWDAAGIRSKLTDDGADQIFLKTTHFGQGHRIGGEKPLPSKGSLAPPLQPRSAPVFFGCPTCWKLGTPGEGWKCPKCNRECHDAPLCRDAEQCGACAGRAYQG